MLFPLPDKFFESPIIALTHNSGIATSTNKYLYSGKEYQMETAFFDFGARYYDAQLGRWHSPDPLNQFASSYVYCANNPTNWVDPTGLWGGDVRERDVMTKYTDGAKGGGGAVEPTTVSGARSSGWHRAMSSANGVDLNPFPTGSFAESQYDYQKGGYLGLTTSFDIFVARSYGYEPVLYDIYLVNKEHGVEKHIGEEVRWRRTDREPEDPSSKADRDITRQTSTSLTGTALGKFSESGKTLHYLPKSKRLKIYNRPYVNQYTVNTKISGRGTAALFLINQGATISDYRMGAISQQQFENETGMNILGAVSPQFGLVFLTYSLIDYFGNVWEEYMNQPNRVKQFNSEKNNAIEGWIEDVNDGGY